MNVHNNLLHDFHYRFIPQTVNSAIVPDVRKHVKEDDEIEVDLVAGKLTNHTTGKELTFDPLPEFILDLIGQGGLILATRKKLGIE